MRKKVIVANWKMNKTPEETIMFIEQFKKMVKDTQNEVIISVPYIDLLAAIKYCDGTNIKVAAQNMHYKLNGTYTGEISPLMLTSIGIRYVIVGHSERRQYFHETDEEINLKVKSALENNLIPILCVGENLEQREKGLTEDIIVKQINLALQDLDENDVAKVILAYEPIWAISAGKTLNNEEIDAKPRTASNDDANEAIKIIRNEISQMYDKEVSDNIEILYGGSVKSSNAKGLFAMSDIDGGLVGGASLDSEEFAKIVNFDII